MSANTVPQEAAALLSKRFSLELATSAPDGKPLASYAPFVRIDGPELCVFLSSLAQHTSNIAKNPRVSAMVIEDECKSTNLFARERLILDCNVERIERNSDEWNHWLEPYKTKFGAIADTLLQLADFNLYLLVPRCGTYIKGFGQAYSLTGTDLSDVRHITNLSQEIQDNSE